jgi:hypothetical protein
VIADFYVEASDALLKMADEAVRLAGCFRGHSLAEAHDGLAVFTAELRQFPVMIGVLTDTLRIDPERLRVGGAGLDIQMMQLGLWLETLVHAHSQSDWLTVADVLELDLEPLLRVWAPLVRQCGEPAAQPQ